MLTSWPSSSAGWPVVPSVTSTPTPALPGAPGQLVPFSDKQIGAMDIQKRGMSEQDHVRYNFGPDGTGCTRKFSCLWTQRFNVAMFFCGAVSNYTDGAGNEQVSRLVPQTDPNFPNWICTKVEFMPYQFAGQDDAPGGGVAGSGSGASPTALPLYNRADFTAVYENVPYKVASDASTTSEMDRYVTRPGYPGADISTDTSYIGLQGGVIQYTTADGSRPAGLPIPYPVGFPENHLKFSVIWRRVPLAGYGPDTVLQDRIFGIVSGQETTPGILGALNLDEIFGYAPLTLQLQGVEARLLPDPAGFGYSWDLKYTFSHKPVPYGHLGYYFTETNKPPLLLGANGYYQVLRPAAGSTTKGAAQINDGDSLFNVRPFEDLFKIGLD